MKALQQIEKTFKQFEAKPIDPWTRIDGSRLPLTSRQYAVREDGVGKLIPAKPSLIIVGRDEHRVRSMKSKHVKEETDRLHTRMTIDRSLVIGKAKSIDSRPAKKSECKIRINQDGKYELPKLFVRYQTPSGTYRFRFVEGAR